MSFQLFIFLLLAIALIFAIVRKLILIAFIILVVAFAYYTGLAGAFFDFVMQFLPTATETTEVAQMMMQIHIL